MREFVVGFDLEGILRSVPAPDDGRGLPGMAAAGQAVRDLGGRPVVLSARPGEDARLAASRAGFPVVDEVRSGSAGVGPGRTLLVTGGEPTQRSGAAGPTVVLDPAGADRATLAGLHALPDWLADWALRIRLRALQDSLRDYRSVVVAFSGGVDSALVVAAAARALGPDRVIAATGVSDSLAAGELPEAEALCASLGVEHVALPTFEMGRTGYRANGRDRCFHCKSELSVRLAALAGERGFAEVATGTNADDVRAPDRPGIAAAAGHGVRTPLADAGLTKAQVRRAARDWGLPLADKPAKACLASRVAYGITVTPARLARVDRAEAAVRRVLAEAGIAVTHIRVRDRGPRASIEVDRDLVAAVADLAEVVAAVVAEGFPSAAVDPVGFRSGALNEPGADTLEEWSGQVSPSS